MHKLTLAERILSPITGAPRANEIVGDLLETAPSTPAFWFSILRIALAYTWRWLIGIPAAMVSIAIIGIPYVEILKPQVELVVSHHKDLGHDQSIQASVYVLLAAIALISIALLALARYGWRSPVARIAAATTMPLAFSAFALCAHKLPLALGLLAIALCIGAFYAIHQTRASVVVLGTAVSFVALFFVWSFCISISIGITFGRLGAGSAIAACITLFLWCSLYIAEAVILSHATRWLRVA